MTTVYIVRHGEAEGNLYRRIHGQYDSSLTENGLRQVVALEERFRPIHLDAVYSSDLRRCRQTARALYEHKGLPLQLDTGLREMNLGEWEDRPWGEVRRTDPDGMEGFQTCSPTFRAPGGESYEELRTRVSGTILKLAARHPGQTIGISTHYIALRSALSVFYGYPVEEINQKIPRCDNTGVSCLEIEGDQVKVVFACDNSHLPPELSTLANQKWKTAGNVSEPAANLWYRPWEPVEERTLYDRFRQETWERVHPGLPYDGETFYRQALRSALENPWSVVCAMRGDEIAGLLQMDLERYQEDNAGFIYFYYVTPEAREQGLGIQLLGQAVATFRPLGRDRIRLRCSEDNEQGMHFYLKYGFRSLGAAGDSTVPLELMEKRID
ncbi:MAG: bifunctional histidine phosphatase family protein/GNAT family N-acetyltransferase [Clostridiales bacterium]|nr:bifunctional histidine phosphatase family protein/GNAT family N-acetyltransferase [Clostridiales bacterium]